MCNEDTTVWVVLNGEIHNYKELRQELEGKGHHFKSHTDTESVIHLYEEYGMDCVRYLRGMFALAIWDERERRLFLARDRLGEKPLLYSYLNGRFSFASEFSGLLASGLIKKKIHKEAINYYLTFGYIPAPMTIYEDVFKLPPAHTLSLKDGRINIHQYWQVDYRNKIKISEEEAGEEILRRLKESVKIRLDSDVPLGAFLSGGTDSSAIVALMAELSTSKVNTFSIGFPEEGYSELGHARRVAKIFNTNHHEFIVRPDALAILSELVSHYGEPYADSSCIPTYYVSKMTRKYVTVALTGDGGDEAFAGYDRYQAVLLAQHYQNIPLFLRKMISSSIRILPAKEKPKNKIKKMKRFLAAAELNRSQRYLYWVGNFTFELKERLLSEEFKRTFKGNPEVEFETYFKDSAGLFPLDQVLRTDMLMNLPNDFLVKTDIASMANSLELRSPFLDHKFVEFAAVLPWQLKIKRGIKKYILKKTLAKFIPKQNLYRWKMGFALPVGEWFRDELKGYLQDNLLSPRSLSRGYFKPEVVKAMVDSHIACQAEYSTQLWSLLMLELWHQRFID